MGAGASFQQVIRREIAVKKKINFPELIDKGIKFLEDLKELAEFFAPAADPYFVLGVSPEDDDELIDAIYKARVKHFHPDKGGDEEACKRLNDAYERIKAERAQQDEAG